MGGAMIMVKAIGVEPVANRTRDVQQGIARGDAFFHVPDPDALAAECATPQVALVAPLQHTDDGLRGFEVQDADGCGLVFGRPHR